MFQSLRNVVKINKIRFENIVNLFTSIIYCPLDCCKFELWWEWDIVGYRFCTGRFVHGSFCGNGVWQGIGFVPAGLSKTAFVGLKWFLDTFFQKESFFFNRFSYNSIGCLQLFLLNTCLDSNFTIFCENSNKSY